MHQQRLRSIKLFESIGLNPSNKDCLYLHALDVIGAVSCMTRASSIEFIRNRNDINNSKRRIFWKTIMEISSQQLDDVDETSTINKMLIAFPDKEKRTDGRMWLPLHFAVSVPGIELKDIRVIVADQPTTISTLTSIDLKYGQEEISVAPCHLAVMTKKPNMALIKLLTMLDPNFASNQATNGSTPLHFAAQYSNSVSLVQRLIKLNPQALEIYNDQDETPLCCVAKNSSFDAPKLLKALIDEAPHTVSQARNEKLPLHRFLSIQDNIVDTTITIEHILILLQAFPDAVNIPDDDGWLPIHVAAENCSVDILKIITEANPEHLSATIPNTGSVAHCAVLSGRIKNTLYIHSIMPELFHTLNEDRQNPLHLATEKLDWYANDEFDTLVSLVPETASNVDFNGNNLLHTLNIAMIQTIEEDQLESLIRHLLRLIPGGALATNNQGQTPYDLLNRDIAAYDTARRLLLLAGAPSLHPETRQQMNYQARKGALFAFFAPRGGENQSGGEGLDICHRIGHGAGAREIIREIVSFL